MAICCYDYCYSLQLTIPGVSVNLPNPGDVFIRLAHSDGGTCAHRCSAAALIVEARRENLGSIEWHVIVMSECRALRVPNIIPYWRSIGAGGMHLVST